MQPNIETVADLIQASSGCDRETAIASAKNITDLSAPLSYSPWRHGGWYVHTVRYPNGACGCVSRNYPDKKWRIACDEREGNYTYPNRDAAARAEQALALAQYTPERVQAELTQRLQTQRAIAADRFKAIGKLTAERDALRATLRRLLDARPLPDDLRRVPDSIIAIYDEANGLLKAAPVDA